MGSQIRLSAISVVCFCMAGQSLAHAAEIKDQSVSAVYDVTFAGVKLGKFSFSSRVTNRQYTLRSHSKMKMAFGAFKWRSSNTSSGTLDRGGPRPARYDFSYKMNKKSGFTKMTFAGGSVGRVERKPSKKSKSRVPVKSAHLKGVLDPMSAILSLSMAKITADSQNGRGHPCARRVPVFDGKQRFDLVLAPKRTERIKTKSAGAPTRAFVCSVKYVPVSGHKMNRSTKFMASNKNIETWMMPIADAGIYAPYRIVLPILVGSAVINTRQLTVKTDGDQPLVLRF